MNVLVASLVRPRATFARRLSVTYAAIGAGALALLCMVAAPVAAQGERVPASAAEITLTFAPVVRQAAPAVVNVHSGEAPSVRARPSLFGLLQPRPPRPGGRALGSGVVVDAEGFVVTNAHVVGRARELFVSFNDRSEYPAVLLLKDDRTDLAILKIERDEPFPFLTFGDMANIEIGDLVLAIGNPFGVGQTVTQGIVSALARTQVGISDERFFIQTDAAINPGNSGGALVDMRGQLVGINTAIYSRSGGSNGIGFAIPTEMVEIVVRSAREGKTVQRPWFGAQLQNVTRDLAEAMGFDRPGGALVTEIVPASPAAEAGFEVGDVIQTVDGVEITDIDAFGYVFATRGTQGEALVAYHRAGTASETAVQLITPPETVPRDPRRLDGVSPFDGAIAMNVSPAVADEVNIDLMSTGVVLARVDRRSVAERVGLRRGDLIVTVNGRDIRTSGQLERVSKAPARYWDVVIERNGRKLSLALGG